MAPSIILSLCLLFLPPAHGHLVIAGGNVTNEVIYSEFINLAKLAGEKPRVAVITTASPSSRVKSVGIWEKFLGKTGSVTEVCTDDPFPDNVDAIWMAGGDQELLEKNYIGKPFEKKLIEFYNKGGIIGGTSAGSAFMSKIMIKGDGTNGPIVGTGLDLLPQAIIDQHFTTRNRLPRLKEAVSHHPGIYGFGIDENTAIVYSNGNLRVIGEKTVTVLHCGTTKELQSGELFTYQGYEGDRPEDSNSRQQANLSTEP